MSTPVATGGRPAAGAVEGLRRSVGGRPLGLLGLLFALNLVDELDRIAFGVLTPELRDAFGLGDAGIVAIGALASIVALLLALPVGWLVDRQPRIGLLRRVAWLWSGMAVLTGLAPGLVVLVAARVGAGSAHVAADPLHSSILGDAYPTATHPRVFFLHRLANPIAAGLAVPIGVAGATIGWRPVFLAISLPVLLLSFLVPRLDEPVRGASVDAELAALTADDAPVPFGEARRQLFAVRTLRRLWLGSFFLGLAIVPIGQLLTLFFEDTYGYDAGQRGLLSFVLGIGSIVGLVVGERLAGRAATANQLRRLPVLVGGSFAFLGVGLLLMALAPWAMLSLILAGVAVLGLGSFQPAYYALVGLVAPPRLRGQAYAWALVIVGLGGLGSVVIAALGDGLGYRAALAVLALMVVAFGGLQATAATSVDADVAQAAATLATALEVRTATGGDGAPLLVCRGLEVAYGGVRVLFGIDLEVAEGEVVALLGTNGAGKSTVLRAISGLHAPSGGAVFFDGRDVTHADAVQTTRLGVVLVPGGKGIFPGLTVEEHVRLASAMLEASPVDVAARLAEALTTFPRLRERWEQPAGNLSGGEQQMLALSLAFLARPKLLLIDELSLGLAPAVVGQLLAFVRRINEAGTTIVVVEQSVNVALALAARAVFLEKGEVRFSGPTADLLDRPDVLRAVFLPEASPAAAARSSAPDASRRPVLEVTRLARAFGGVQAVRDVSLTVAAGEVVGLIGSNGAGKTTVFDLISGFLAPDAGRVVLDGVDLTGAPAWRRAAAGLGRSFQDARLFPSMSVADNIALALERHIAVRDLTADFLALPATTSAQADVAFTVEALIDLLALGSYRDKLVGELSTGSRRIVDLAMAIAHRPSVLLFDEPSSGVAQREVEALGPLLLRLRDDLGCALLVIEHDLPLLSSISDRIVALELGAVLCEGQPADVLADPRVVASYLGTDDRAVARSGGRS